MDALKERLLAKRAITAESCWEWQGKPNHAGYGRIGVGNHTNKYVHRLAYEIYIGAIPDGYEVDHLCFNRACFNPAHLEAVTPLQNKQRLSPRKHRRTHCLRDHELTQDNTYTFPDGRRACRTCHRVARRRFRELNLEARRKDDRERKRAKRLAERAGR